MNILTKRLKSFLVKCLVVLISATVIFSVCSVGININTKAEEAQNQFWSGNTVSGYTDFEGKGTEKEPFLIKTPEQLAFAVGKNPALGDHIYYKLANDIKINDTSKTDWEASAKSWKRYDHARFGGVLDGDGYTIDGLYISTNTTTGRYGFISYIGGPKNGSYVAEVKNLKFTNASINHTATSTASNLQGMAVVAGQTSGKVIFEKIYVDETCKVNAPNVKGVAGIAGRGYDNGNNADPTIKNCTVLATITGNSHVGAIVGSYWAADANVTIEKCFAVTNTGLVGAKDKATLSITDTYTTTLGTLDAGATQVDAANMKGENAKTYMPNLDFETVWQTVDGGFPALRAPERIEIWDGTAAESYAGGLGTQESPWKIETAAQLFKMVKENTTVNTDAAFAEMKYFKITKDIVINPVTAEDMVNPTVAAWDAKGYKTWNPGYTGNQNSNGFYGVVDGGGHTISGLYVKEGQYVGLIPVIVDNASITNIKVTNSFVRASSGSASPGIIVGIVYGKKNNYPTFDLTYSSIDNCYVLADATSSWRIGGLVGGAYDAKKITISDCSATNLKMHTTNTGTVGRTGAFIGNVGSGSHVVKNCFTDASTHPVSNTTDNQTNYDQLHKYITWTNVYTAAAKPSFDKYNDITYLTADQMKGENAKTNMTGLNFETVFETVENDYPIINVREPAVPPTAPLWDGTKDSNLEGEGTEELPYLIKTPEQLAYVVATNLPDGKYFKLANDIKIHDTTKANWKEGAINWLFGNVRFIGTFDGDGHTIDGLYYKGKQQRMGLFSYVGADDAGAHQTTIKNFKMTNAYIENDNTGAGTKLEGTAFVAPQTERSTTFEHIYIDESCTLVAKNFKGVAGIAARGSSSAGITVTIRECAMLGNITGTDSTLVGAFTGTYWRTSDVLNVTGCINASGQPIFGQVDKAAINAINNYALVADAQGTTVLTSDQMKGEEAKTNMPGLDFDTVWKTVDDGFPVIDLREGAPPPVLPDYVWDGTKAEAFADGKGTKEEPFKISTPEQLYKMVVEYSDKDASYGKYFVITNDIYLNDVEGGTAVADLAFKRNWLGKYGTEVPSASKANSFAGTLDGGGHTIYGLYASGAAYAGLFPALSSGVTIKNLVIDNAEITGCTTSAGGIAGKHFYADWKKANLIESCAVVNASIEATGGSATVGGLIGDVESSAITFRNCYSYNATLSDSAVPGGIVGNAWKAKTEDPYPGKNIKLDKCYSVGNFPVRSNVSMAVCTDVYSSEIAPTGNVTENITVLPTDKMKGDKAKTNMPGLLYGINWQTVENGYPIHKIYVSPDYVWDGDKENDYTGSGTETDPYIIKTPEQLAYIATTSLEAGKYYKLANDIYLNDTSIENWKAIAKNWVWGNVRFQGTFDGDGHTIHGLYFNGAQTRFGLFGYVGDSVFKNVKFSNAYIYNTIKYDPEKDDIKLKDTAQGVAILVGQTSAATSFNGIYIDETCEVHAPYTKGVAGIAGRGSVDVNVANSAVLATVTGSEHVGSFFGTYWGEATLTLNGSFSASNAPISDSLYISGSNNYATFKEGELDKTVTLLTHDQMKGEAAADNMSGLNFESVFKTTDSYPVIDMREVPPPPPRPELPEYVWDGTVAASFAGGDGTEANPFLIENGAQLYKMVVEYSTRTASKGKYFKITKDIYLNDVKDGTAVELLAFQNKWLEGYGKGTIPVASKENSFCGTLDGGYNTIYGLYIKNVYSSGLFAAVSSGVTVKNLEVSNAFITGGSGFAGGIAGQLIYIDWTLKNKFESCAVTNATIGIGGNIQFVGGLVGDVQSCAVTFRNCYTYDLDLSDWVVPGGIVGNAWNANKDDAYPGGNITLENCYSIGNFPVRSNVGLAKLVNVYTDTAAPAGNPTVTANIVSADKLKGETAKETLVNFDFKRVWKTVKDGYPVHFMYVRPANAWDGKIADKFAGGTGTAEDPYLIENGGQLYKMVAEFSNQPNDVKPTSRPYFRIIKDIDLDYAQWYTISTNAWLDSDAYKTIGFNGVIYGDGHTIKGLYNEKTAGAVGLIPVATQGAEIHNLYLDGGKLPRVDYSTYAVGAFIGLARSVSNSAPIIIKGCSVKNFQIGAVNGAAAFIGYAYSQSVGIYNSFCADTTIIHTAEKSANSAAFIGYTGGNDWLNTILIANSYCADVNPVPYLNDKFQKITSFVNVYTNFEGYDKSVDGIVKLKSEQMKGENAKKHMKGFDFEKAWKTVENGYPELRLNITPDYIWDGGTASSFAGGTGTPYDPYIIKTGAQLYKMVSEYSNASTESGATNTATYFKLANDIYLNDVEASDLENANKAHWNSKFNSWYSQTSYSKGFCGNLDGNGFTVYGLYANGGYAGLIPNLMDGGSVHNLNLKNSYITGTESAGSIVGFVKAHWKMAPVSVSYCTVDNVVVESTKKYVGGIIGGFGDIKINVNDCSATNMTLKTTDENAKYATGLIGYGWGKLTQTVTNAFTDSSISPVTYTDSSSSFKVEYTNVYTSAKKNGSVKGITYLADDGKLQGANVAKILKGFNFKEDWKATDSYPVIMQGAGAWRYDTTTPGQVWSGKVSASYASGDGSKETPYKISTGGQLALLANDALSGKTTGKYYQITANIILNDTSNEDWVESAHEWYTGSWAQAFRGHLDGGYHIISGLYLNNTKETYDGKNYYGGLFAALGQGAVIEKLGVVNSSLTFTHDVDTKYLGVFAGFIDQYDIKKVKANEYPIIRECFADTTVYLEGGSCGGFIGCATRPVKVENSFFTGKVETTGRGLFGYSKLGEEYEGVLVKNFYTADAKYAVVSNQSYDNIKYENCYSSSAQDKEGITRLFIDRMLGEEAKEYMVGFDFNKMWILGEKDETPGLRGFNKKLYSNTMNPEDITVSFETNCALKVESITGKAYSKIELPVLEREGYTFCGWYTYPELDTPFTYDYFPTFDTILYAKWTINGFMQDFEKYENTVYDYHEGLDYFRPTSLGYNSKYVRSGGKAMHRLAGGNDYRDFLVFYAEELEIGKTYTMVYYTTTDQEKASIDMALVHLEWPDVYSANSGVQKMGKITGLKDGEWQENTFTFVAKSKWVAIRTTGDASIYFDDIGLFETDSAAALAGFFGSVWGIVTIVVLALLVACGAVAFVLIIKKRK